MVTKKDIDLFIEKIPPTPKILQATMMLVNNGELSKAAKIAEQDLALKSYLSDLVNKPLYGFRNKVSDIGQIFGILGLPASQQTLYNYMLTLLSPKKWELFKLNEKSFSELQVNLSIKWKKILEHLNIVDKDIESAITLLPASIIVSEALFAGVKKDVELLRSVHNLDYNTILQRLCGTSLFDICVQIADKWDMPENISEIVLSSSGLHPSNNHEIDMLAKWMHLLLFYELSQPMFVEATLNDFIDFQIDYVSDIYEEFAQVMEIE
ncbi:HDOD domain-containing protein [Sulfurimonas lithotrophica]|uniref:HDOD domain-containing protein n=1 Tax=Sulfurimonas lithotrophica TaxID=2590022 RepID=A0A5P8P251_9BACT|nr:HDOD domain-containing protein [Sulfurimonas lithotrophica]QFR49802.1 HDOD domain-containing protein [Sulfurimonas lithotrophica]